MKSLALKAPAKINLGLSILRKLPSGYHEVKTIYTQVSLFDFLRIEETAGDMIRVYGDDKTIPYNKLNSVYQAADLIKKIAKTERGVNIFLKKNIPVGAGLGGGSSDAAVTLKGLNKLWHLNLSLDQLIKLGKIIGADVPYHLIGKVQLEVQGGEKAGKFISLGRLPSCLILVCFPQIKIESKAAYSQIEYEKIGKNDLSRLIGAIKKKDLTAIGKNLDSDFELWTFKKHPVIDRIKKKMIEYGALGSLMSGKGSAVFGIFQKENQAKNVYNVLKKEHQQTFLIEPL